MTFSLSTVAQADQLSRGPAAPFDSEAGFFTGVTSAPLSGLARGVIGKPALLAGEALTPVLRPIARDLDTMLGTDLQGFLEDERKKNVQFLKDRTPDPQSTGMAAQVLHSLFDIVPGAVWGGPQTAAILEGVAQKKLAEDRGVDPTTANVHGLVQGVATGVGVAIPMSLGLKTVPDLAYAAVSNIIPNAAARAASHRVLAEAGYTDMAAQYQALDRDAILADGVLGIFFAGAGRLVQGASRNAQERILAKAQPSDVDAALTAKAQHHLELDSAPGIPRDPVSRDAHVQSALKASEDLLAGRPVDVGTRLDEAQFERDPAKLQYAKTVNEEVKAHLGDAYDRVLREPLGPADDPLVRFATEKLGDVIVERGAAWQEGFEIKTGGHGLVKFIFKHGEKSSKSPDAQVSREDVIRLPDVMRDYLPIRDDVRADGKRTLEWQVERQDGRRVMYVVAKFTESDADHHAVSVFVNEQKTDAFKKKPLSQTKNRLESESPVRGSKPRGGVTGPDSFSSPPGGREGGSDATVARAGADAKAEPLEVALARQATEARPDMQVMGEDGQAIKATDLLKQADEQAVEAQTMAKGYEAAVSCFLRGGA
jgi:hypothetical protein